jgi:hypothetical protein
MGPLDFVDLVQDITTDCSVVASLCAGTARASKGHGKVCIFLVSLIPLRLLRMKSYFGQYVTLLTRPINALEFQRMEDTFFDYTLMVAFEESLSTIDSQRLIRLEVSMLLIATIISCYGQH